jgi:hypothetical protein
MGRTQAELFAWSARVREQAAAAQQQARVLCARAQELRAQRSSGSAIAITVPVSTALITDDLPIEESAERALMREFTALEIAEYLKVPVKYVMRAAQERATFTECPVEDTLRVWFRVLLA